MGMGMEEAVGKDVHKKRSGWREDVVLGGRREREDGEGRDSLAFY
jgi:hypothetical protein